MARPRKEGMDYFPHDTDATDDEKLEAMRALFGNDGYAFYFILCERIYRTSNAELDVSKQVLLIPIVKKLLVPLDKFNEMMDAALEIDLFSRADYENRGVITSRGIKKRFSEVESLRKRWRKHKENPQENIVFHAENEHNSEFSAEKRGEETPESKAKQSKEKKKELSSSCNAFELFESEGFGTISSIVADKINDFIDTYGERWTYEAMKQAVYQGKRKLSYVNGILMSWKSEGIDEPWKEEKHAKTDRQPNQRSPAKQDSKAESHAGTKKNGWLRTAGNATDWDEMRQMQ